MKGEKEKALEPEKWQLCSEPRDENQQQPGPQKATLASRGVEMLASREQSYMPVVQRLFLAYSWPMELDKGQSFAKDSSSRDSKGSCHGLMCWPRSKCS